MRFDFCRLRRNDRGGEFTTDEIIFWVQKKIVKTVLHNDVRGVSNTWHLRHSYTLVARGKLIY